MTTNAFLFIWDYTGLEAVVPITQYEDQKMLDVIAILKEEPLGKNPLNTIYTTMMWRARFNPDRRYEIYAVDCTKDFTQQYWEKEFKERPQETVDLIREKGVKLFGHKAAKEIKIA